MAKSKGKSASPEWKKIVKMVKEPIPERKFSQSQLLAISKLKKKG